MGMTDRCHIRSNETLGLTMAEWISEGISTGHDRLGDVFVLDRWLSTPAGRDSLTCPCEIRLHEKPDFIVTSERMSAGIEVTRFLAEQRARAAKITNEEHTDHSPTDFDFDSPPRRNDEIRQIVRREPLGLTGWRSIPGTLDLYAEKFEEILASKTRKAIVETTQACSSYWLVIEDQHFLNAFNLHHLNRMLTARLAQYWRSEPAFDRIYFSSITDKNRSLEFRKPAR